MTIHLRPRDLLAVAALTAGLPFLLLLVTP
jgi:hypothetical protein